MKKRKIAVFTGNRAEYGLLMPVIKAISKNQNLKYHLIVSGAHLDTNFGATKNEIKKDGLKIGSEVDIKKDSNLSTCTSSSIGQLVLGITKILSKINPDILLVYADRFESFAAVIAASQMNIPIAHVEGGDLTEGGALDDSVRHAITKLSHLHFTTNQQASNRIIGMGEEAWRVNTVGLPIIDLISENNYAKPLEIINKFDISLNRPIILFTQHPITTNYRSASMQLNPSLKAIEKVAKQNVQVIITFPNNDVGSSDILASLKLIEEKALPNISLHTSIGRYFYHGILALAKNKSYKVVCVGNSSSGIKETPAFGCPAVNIGSRQDGRLRGVNVIDTNYNSREIIKAMNKSLFDETFRKKCRLGLNPYGLGGSGKKIAKILSTISLNQKLLLKKMSLKGEIRNGWYR